MRIGADGMAAQTRETRYTYRIPVHATSVRNQPCRNGTYVLSQLVTRSHAVERIVRVVRLRLEAWGQATRG
jgi:hypothetical protein